MLRKIISGGQTGADQGGLEAGRQLGLETGGIAPAGFYTEKGRNPDLLKGYGLIEGPKGSTIADDYRIRTAMNVRDSDATVLFGNPTSPGSKLTVRSCRDYGRACLINPTLAEVKDVARTIEVLNVAGNRESRQPGIYNSTVEFLVEALIGVVQRGMCVCGHPAEYHDKDNFCCGDYDEFKAIGPKGQSNCTCSVFRRKELAQ